MSWTRTIAASAALVLLGVAESFGAAAATDRSAAERIWYAQGLTHPIVVHVPIALTLAAAIAVVLRVVFRRISLGIVYYCLLIGALGAIPSTLAGWAWAPQKDGGYADAFDLQSNIFWHRWGGVALTVAGLAIAAWATVRIRARVRYDATIATTNASGEKTATVEKHIVQRAPGQFGWQFATVLLAAGMGWVAHDGGELVYPNNFKRMMAIASGDEPVKLKGQGGKKEGGKKEPAVAVASAGSAVAGMIAASPSATQPAGFVTAPPPTTGPAVLPTTNPAEPMSATPVVQVAASGKVDFAKQVWPIWVEKCNYCHGAEKQKGKLRMDSEAFCKEGGTDDGPLYTPGKGKESPLIVRAHSDDEDVVMPPPKEKKALTPEEIEVMTKWVDEGAIWNLPPGTAGAAQ